MNCILHEGTLWYEYSILYHRFPHWLRGKIKSWRIKIQYTAIGYDLINLLLHVIDIGLFESLVLFQWIECWYNVDITVYRNHFSPHINKPLIKYLFTGIYCHLMCILFEDVISSQRIDTCMCNKHCDTSREDITTCCILYNNRYLSVSPWDHVTGNKICILFQWNHSHQPLL